MDSFESITVNVVKKASSQAVERRELRRNLLMKPIKSPPRCLDKNEAAS
jgi:hypothetical protein